MSLSITSDSVIKTILDIKLLGQLINTYLPEVKLGENLEYLPNEISVNGEKFIADFRVTDQHTEVWLEIQKSKVEDSRFLLYLTSQFSVQDKEKKYGLKRSALLVFTEYETEPGCSIKKQHINNQLFFVKVQLPAFVRNRRLENPADQLSFALTDPEGFLRLEGQIDFIKTLVTNYIKYLYISLTMPKRKLESLDERLKII